MKNPVVRSVIVTLVAVNKKRKDDENRHNYPEMSDLCVRGLSM
jgi:hypothetical protein